MTYTQTKKKVNVLHINYLSKRGMPELNGQKKEERKKYVSK